LEIPPLAAGDLAGWIVAGAIFGALIVAGCELWLTHVSSHDHSMTRFLIFSVPAILLARLIADAALAGLTEVVPRSDGNLEWAARAGGIYALFLIGWLVWFALILAGGQAVVLAGPGMLKAVFGVTTVSGIGAALLGKSVWTKAIGDIQEARNFLGLNGLTLVGAALFAAGLIITVASLLDNMLEAQIFMVLPGYNVKQSAAAALAAGTQQWSIGLLPPALVLVTIAASLLINVNRFSLHGTYRNRLTRAFLGASRLATDRERTRNRFTDFDSADTPLIADLMGAQQGAAGRRLAAAPRRQRHGQPGLVEKPGLAGADGGPVHVFASARRKRQLGIHLGRVFSPLLSAARRPLALWRALRPDARHGDGDFGRGGQPVDGLSDLGWRRLFNDDVQRAAGVLARQSAAEQLELRLYRSAFCVDALGAGDVRPDDREEALDLSLRRGAFRESRAL
jgi:hypothetical protein